MSLIEYINSLQQLPAELRKNLLLIGDLDSKAEGNLKEADDLQQIYLSSFRSMPKEERVAAVNKIHRLRDEACDIGKEKVSLAMQTYELVDQHILKLDQSVESSGVLSIPPSAGSASEGPGGASLRSVEASRVKIRKKKLNQGRTPELLAKKEEVPASVPRSERPLPDMPVDPNEPTYCICRDVSYGEMVGCDNQDCPIEWFHFPCVNLTKKPDGKWFCPTCTARGLNQ